MSKKCKAFNQSGGKCSHLAVLNGKCMIHFLRDEYKLIKKDKTAKLFLFFVLMLFVTSCLPHYNDTAVIQDTTVDIVYNHQSSNATCKIKNYLPDSFCTPGSHFPLTTLQVNGQYAEEPGSVIVGDICIAGYSKNVRNVPISVKNQVLKNYGIVDYNSTLYEIDHLIPLSIGGDNNIKNLWPEHVEGYGYKVKDNVERCFLKKVCEGKMLLEEAQNIMSDNWTKGIFLCNLKLK